MICSCNCLFGAANKNNSTTKLGDETVAKQHVIISLL